MLENTVGASAKLVRTETEYEGLLEEEELEEDVFRREEEGGGNVIPYGTPAAFTRAIPLSSRREALVAAVLKVDSIRP